MRVYLCLIFAVVGLTLGFEPVRADQCRTVRFHALSIYGQNYTLGFDKGYASAWNACRTGDELFRWVRDWSEWIITNPAYVRGYQEGVRQALKDAEFLDEDNVLLHFYGEETR